MMTKFSDCLGPLFAVACLGLIAGCAHTEVEKKTVQMDWSMVEEIVEAIELPSIPDRDYLVTDFGAIGDGKQDARPAIMVAIKKAHADGGGRVVLPEGTWLSQGPIHLMSRINLHISEGAVLKFGADADDYLPMVLSRWEGTELYSYSPLIYGYQVEDVAITGKGLIDGNSESEFHAWYDKQEPDQLQLRHMGAEGVPVAERKFGQGHYLRPSMLMLFDAQRVLLEDYTIINSPFWVNHLVYTDHAVMRGITVNSMFANNDGVDVDSSRYVLIENNKFVTGDDAVVVKSGRDLDGRTIGRPSEYVVVRNNDMAGEDGIALGSEMSGDIRYVFFTDNILRNGTSAIRFKANLDRGGVVEHIRVRNMKIGTFRDLFWFQLNYPGELGGYFPSVYRDLVFENITVEKVDTVLEVHAPDGHPLRDVTLRNIEVMQADELFILENVEGLVLENVRINGERVNGNLDWQ
jgi:polygalacturonase